MRLNKFMTGSIRNLCRTAGVLVVLSLLASPLMAGDGNKDNKDDKDKKGDKGSNGAPELDPGSISSAVLLLAGGSMLIADKRRSRKV